MKSAMRISRLIDCDGHTRIGLCRERTPCRSAEGRRDVHPPLEERHGVRSLQTVVQFGVMTNKMSLVVVILVLAAPRTIFACAACSGRSDDLAAQGLNAAVFTLLTVLLAVLSAFVCSLIYLIRRAAKHPLALPEVPEGVVR